MELLVVTVEMAEFFTVDFYGDKIGVDNFGDGFIFERFMRHDMTPMTGTVPDGDENRFMLFFGTFQYVLIPCDPVDRILRVLLQIRGRRVNEGVGSEKRRYKKE